MFKASYYSTVSHFILQQAFSRVILGLPPLMIEKNTMKTLIPLLLLAILSLVASCNKATITPEEPDPLELLYFSPDQDSLVVTEQDSLVFVLRTHCDGPISAEALLEGVQFAQSDSLIFRAWEHLDLQIACPDSFLTLEILVSDELDQISRAWEMKILWGYEFFPVESELVNVLGQTVMFKMHIEAGGLEPEYRFFVDEQLVGEDSEIFYFQALQIGTYRITGRIILDGHEWTHDWTVEVQPDEPVDPPETVTDLRSGPGSVPGMLAIAFLPPEEGLREPVHSFEIRAFPYLIDDDQWETAYLIGLEEKTQGAVEERFDLPGPAAGMNLYLRVRSVGVSGNTSPWCDPVEARVAGYSVRGRLWDFEIGEPLPGMNVKYGDVLSMTDEDGYFFCDDVPYMFEADGIHDFPGSYYDDSGSGIGDWFDLLDPRSVTDSLEYRMGTFSTEPFESVMYSDFLEYFISTFRPPSSNFHLIRPVYPITTYIPEYVNEGCDYAAVCVQGMEIWNTSTGLDFFERVYDPEEAVLSFVYDDTTSITGITQILEFDLETLTPLELQITLRANFTEAYAHGLYQVTFHELGHAMGFWIHSLDTNYCMSSSNQQDAPHPDEIRLARVVYHMECYEDLGFLLHE